jgi:hypothetical protein
MYITSIVFLKVGMLGKISQQDSETGGLANLKLNTKDTRTRDELIFYEVGRRSGRFKLLAFISN